MLRKIFKLLTVLAALFAVSVIAARLLFPLPDISSRVSTHSIPASNNTLLGRTTTDIALNYPGLSGVFPLADGTDALMSRLAAISQAQESIDAQYYIWQDDISGILLLDALDQAAQKEVRIRLLLDDNGVPGLDPFLATLNTYENFEVRLFNPSTVRSPKAMGFLFDLFRMNRRMHNKSLTVDGAVTIIGGRNIGDEYFEIGEAFYKDLDVLATGEIVPEMASTFDEYWNSKSVFEVENMISGTGDRVGFEQRVADVKSSARTQIVLTDVQNSAAKFMDGFERLEWTTVQLVADDPKKGEGLANRDDLMVFQLGDILGDIESRIDLASAYFVPGETGAGFFAELAQQGVDVNILTNAMNTTDVMMVHAGYTKYRRDLLMAGADLFELRLRNNANGGTENQINPVGLSGASLHAKTFAIDGERVFIGSFNFDPRSANLNCEMGFLIDSPTIAQAVSDVFDMQLALVSYKPFLTADGRMVWLEAAKDSDSSTIWQQEPGTSWLKQMSLTVLQILPVEWLL
jgi:cardiolipin synthase C